MRKILMLMMAVACLAVLMAPPVSAQVTYYNTFDGATYYSAPVSYVSPVSYSYSVPISYSGPVSYSTAVVYAADDPANFDQCPQCGRHHIPKGMQVVGSYQSAFGRGVITQPAMRSSYVSYSTLPTYVSYSGYANSRASGGCASGNCNR